MTSGPGGEHFFDRVGGKKEGPEPLTGKVVLPPRKVTAVGDGHTGNTDVEDDYWVPKRKRNVKQPGPEQYAPAREPFRLAAAAKTFLISFLSVLAVFAIVQTFLIQIFVIPSGSMENTLQVNDRIAVWKIGQVKKGDIIVFSDPGGWIPQNVRTGPNFFAAVMSKVNLAPSPDTGYLVKRVIGKGGDRVQCCTADGQIVVNGEPRTEPYLKPGALSNQIFFDVTVPEGTVFVMGDNRANSADSRYHMGENFGTVPEKNIIGKEFLVIG